MNQAKTQHSSATGAPTEATQPAQEKTAQTTPPANSDMPSTSTVKTITSQYQTTTASPRQASPYLRGLKEQTATPILP